MTIDSIKMVETTDKRWLLLIVFVLGLVVMAIFLLQNHTDQTVGLPAILAEVAVNPQRQVTEVGLTDHQNHTVTTERFAKHWNFVYFGYTHCPDVCPATLAQLAEFKQSFLSNSPLNDKIQFFFVSVDPARDTIEQLATYIQYFDQSFIAMSGKPEAIGQFESQLGAYHRFGHKSASGEYAVQHSADVYLLNPAGRLIAKFGPPINLGRMLEQITGFIERYPKAVT